MKPADFHRLPHPLTRRQVLRHCLISDWTLRKMVGSGAVRTVRVGATHRYVRASLAPLLGVVMDWSDWNRWPALLRPAHLLELGLTYERIDWMVRHGVLPKIKGMGHSQFPKVSVGKLIGKEA